MKRLSIVLLAFIFAGSIAFAEPFYSLLFNGTPAQVQAAINAGADVNQRFGFGKTPLMCAGELGVVKILLKAGADVNAKDQNGWTPLIYAAYYDSDPNVISVLLKAGADINARSQDAWGWTPLMLAASYRPENVMALLKAGANAKLKSTYGETAFDLAKRMEVKATVEFFESLRVACGE